jgi:predicted amidohydrolase YtcJ
MHNVAELLSANYTEHLWVCGAKLNLDGGSPSRTAYLSEPYHMHSHGMPSDYRGYPAIKEQQNIDKVKMGSPISKFWSS